MGRSVNSTRLTKQFVLSKVSQITIFSTYLNLTDNIVQNCIDSGELICSPIREDNHPTCGFKYDNKGKLKFRDFSGFFWGDCFDVVAFVMSNIYNKQFDVNCKEDFVKILRHITFTFKDIFYGKEKDINLINEINTSITKIKYQKPIIELVVREWNEYDRIYWGKFGVSIKDLNINFIYPVEQYYINKKVNPNPKYYYDYKDPCYGYFLGKDRQGVNNIKLYFPNRSKSVTRFITNCNHLEGIYNLDKTDYDIIVLTKSTKDRVSIRATIRAMASLYGGGNVDKIGVINIPHETYRLRQNEYDWLNSKLNHKGKIVSIMDNDRTGKREAIWLKNNYRIIPILIPEKYKSKDFAELIYNHNKGTVYRLILDTINKLKSYDEQNSEVTWDTEETDSSLPY